MTPARSLRLLVLLLAFFVRAEAASAQLQGIVDVHAHPDPDVRERRIDALDLVRSAQQAGLRAIVLKSHQAPTAQLAYLVGRLVPGIEVFGSIAMNRAVGGLNPDAVAAQAALKGNRLKIVWMPTYDVPSSPGKPAQSFVPVSKDGHLLPAAIDVLKVVAQQNLTLATGHVGGADTLMIIDEARKLGISRIVVTHPSGRLTMAEMQDAVKRGALIEFTAAPMFGGPDADKVSSARVAEYVKAIRAIGAEFCVVSGDLGPTQFPDPVAAWKATLAVLKSGGLSDREIDLVARRNPARLLGLE